jgi:uncharacterized protein YabE (DUF348 family)
MELKRSYWDPGTRRFSLPPLSIRQAPPGLVAFVAMLIFSAVLIWGYVQSLASVRIIVDGKSSIIHTNQPTVAAVLRDAGVKLYPEDRIIPPLTTSVEDGDAIRVDHARPVVVNVDGQTICTRSLKNSPTDILADLGVKLSPYDKLILDGQPVETTTPLASGQLAFATFSNRAGRDASLSGPSQAPRTITVQRAVTLTVRSTGVAPVTLHATAPRVGEALHEAGITVYLADKISPELGMPVSDGQVVNIDPAVPITILADSRHLHTRTHRKTVGEALAEVGIPLQGSDHSDPAPNAPLKRDMTIRVVRVSETFRIEQEPVPFEIQWMPDSEMEIDNQELRQTGENGVLQNRIRVRYEDGKEVSRQLEDSGIIRQPKTKIIAYGTKIVVRTLDTPNGPIEYWRKIRMLATAYTASTAGTPQSASYYGRTRLGWNMRFGVVAVDPSVVRLGSQVYVAGYGIGDAGDTGGAIQKRRIDLGYDDGDSRVWGWHHWVDVYLLTPVPDNVNYVIPDWPPEP